MKQRCIDNTDYAVFGEGNNQWLGGVPFLLVTVSKRTFLTPPFLPSSYQVHSSNLKSTLTKWTRRLAKGKENQFHLIQFPGTLTPQCISSGLLRTLSFDKGDCCWLDAGILVIPTIIWHLYSNIAVFSLAYCTVFCWKLVASTHMQMCSFWQAYMVTTLGKKHS